MVAAGRKAAPEIEWLQQDLASWQPTRTYDLIYSNAALHWLPDHGKLFPALMQKVAPGGMLAVQMPRNFLAPSHVLIGETALNGPWRSKVEHLVTPPQGAEKAAFEAAYGERVAKAYPKSASGQTLFPFRRLFMVAQRKG
jgi:trans-aconitate 2-methyltransferase